jgi:uncharacterized protein (TIGR03000 family)
MHRILPRFWPLALVLACLPAAPARAQGPAKTLGELDERAAAARLREYVSEEPALPPVKALQEQTDCNVATLFFDHGVPVWLYVPADKSKLDRKLVEDNFRALLEQALVKDFDPLLDPAAVGELREKARFQEWRVAGDLTDLDNDLARLWVGSYLRETRPALAGPLGDRVVLDPAGLRFREGKPTWIIATPAGKKLSAEEKTLLAEELRKLLVQALGRYRGGLLAPEATRKLDNEELQGNEWVLQPAEPAPAPRLGGAGSGAGPEGRTTGMEDQVRLLQLELTATRQQVRELQEEVQRLAGLVRNQGGASRAPAGPLPQQQSTTARFTVRLPADVRMSVNGIVCPLTSDTRTFESPPLQPGKEYKYTIRAEGRRGGRLVGIQKEVVFAAGKQVEVDLRPDFDLGEAAPGGGKQP